MNKNRKLKKEKVKLNLKNFLKKQKTEAQNIKI